MATVAAGRGGKAAAGRGGKAGRALVRYTFTDHAAVKTRYPPASSAVRGDCTLCHRNITGTGVLPHARRRVLIIKRVIVHGVDYIPGMIFYESVHDEMKDRLSRIEKIETEQSTVEAAYWQHG